MDLYELEESLVDAVINFANKKLKHPDNVAEAFGDLWPMLLLPRLRTCRDVQRETREWLSTLEVGTGFEKTVAAMLGRRINDEKENMERVDSGIRYGGSPGFRIFKDGKKVRREITRDLHISQASLRAICGYSVASIYQAGLQDRVGLCERDGCDNLFIDRVSRGTRRRHCLGDECERARNAARQDTWRKRHAKQRSRKA